jgi:hypothetical protein
MKTPAKLGAFALLLGVVGPGGWVVGRAIEPIAPATATHGSPAGSGSAAQIASDADLGLSIAGGGYRLVPEQDTLAVGRAAPYRFRIVDTRGRSVTRFDETHERLMHLFVVRQDLSDFQHLHPTLGADGRWSVQLAAPAPGPYRIFADFQPSNGTGPLTFSTSALAPGDAAVVPLGGEQRRAEVDGYELVVDGDLTAAASSAITITVRRAGRPVTDLEPYLGAAGHLVVLRAGDLANVHVHPTGAVTSGPSIPFAVTVPSAADYRLFLDFQHEGTVRTASFTLAVAASPGARTAEHDGGHVGR